MGTAGPLDRRRNLAEGAIQPQRARREAQRFAPAVCHDFAHFFDGVQRPVEEQLLDLAVAASAATSAISFHFTIPSGYMERRQPLREDRPAQGGRGIASTAGAPSSEPADAGFSEGWDLADAPPDGAGPA
jgi:hypothetical protein